MKENRSDKTKRRKRDIEPIIGRSPYLPAALACEGHGRAARLAKTNAGQIGGFRVYSFCLISFCDPSPGRRWPQNP